MGYLFKDTVGILGNILSTGREIQVECDTCGGVHRFTVGEIAALAAKVGLDYNLVNRRCRCRLNPECWGWNRFFFRSGTYRPLWDDATSERWSMEAWREKMALPPSP